jgi:dCMP deaminase
MISSRIKKLEKYFGLVQATASLSKDSSTKVGAIILGPSFEVRSLGYNGAPRGCSADEDDRGRQRPEKYFWFSHAELNAITNAARVGTPLDGCSLIVTHPPCMDCARAIVQAGITCVLSATPTPEFLARWDTHTDRSLRLFNECGVEYHWIE